MVITLAHSLLCLPKSQASTSSVDSQSSLVEEENHSSVSPTSTHRDSNTVEDQQDKHHSADLCMGAGVVWLLPSIIRNVIFKIK